MQLIEAVPLTNIPRPNSPFFTYYYSEELCRFSLVEVSVGKTYLPALVVSSKNLENQKAAIRKAIFQLKAVERIIYRRPVLFEWQFTLALWIANYYFASLGLVLKRFTLPYLINTKRELSYLPSGELASLPQTLLLVPDTSFFEQEKIRAPYKNYPVTFVSAGAGAKKRYEDFRAIALGNARLIMGTKITLFAPFSALDEIHIYEESDKNHTSWDQKPRYNAVVVAKEMAKLLKSKITYHSTLPSLGHFYQRISFVPFKRGEKTNPNIVFIDLTKEKPRLPFSDKAIALLRETYTQGKQVMVYVNRRGEARIILCRDCGYVPLCPSCELPLTYHREPEKKLLCHHCSTKLKPPSVCPQCQSHEIRYYGFGTQRVEAELTKMFPKANIMRLDSDVVPDEHTKKTLIKRFLLGGNVLVATSMVFQVNIPPLDSVIALNVDTEMNTPHFAAYERLFFTLWRLRGLARRAYLIQTYNLANPLFPLFRQGKWKAFYREELEHRDMLSYPPFSTIIKVTFVHKREAKAREEGALLLQKLQRQIASLVLKGVLQKEDILVLGPAPAFLYKQAGFYRYQFLLKVKPQDVSLRNKVLAIIPPSWDIDIDPVEI